MKIYFITLILLASLALDACKTKSGKNSGGESAETSEASKKVTKRRYFINEENSYSNFFFDSSSLSQYLAANKVSDTLSRRMISFYNNRNYQYAWFSGTGPTEQARGF